MILRAIVFAVLCLQIGLPCFLKKECTSRFFFGHPTSDWPLFLWVAILIWMIGIPLFNFFRSPV